MNRDMRIAFICIITTMTFVAVIPVGQAATLQKVELLWPNGAPGAKGTDEGDKPTLTIYLPEKEKATGAAVVIFPGGGYGHLAMDHEGIQIAQWLNSIGVAGFILKYRHSNSGAGYGHPAPIDEILTIAKDHGLCVIEDCAQAHGAIYRDRRIGSFGDMACFSFYR